MFFTAIIFLVVLSVLVFVHEFGHFITAKKLGVRVDEFGFGFPPRAFFVKRGGTVYSLNWIPLGGFVKIKGEMAEEATGRDSFATQSAPRRLVILAAGVVMNMLLAWFLFSVGTMIGLTETVDAVHPSATVRNRAVTVTDVLPDSPAAATGIGYGDNIIAVNGASITEVAALQEMLRGASGEVVLTLKRGQASREVRVTPVLLEQTGKPGIGVGLLETGKVSYPFWYAPVRGAQVTVMNTLAVFQAFGGLIVGLVSGKGVSADVAGPVGIAVATGEVARLGFIYLLQFTALLSINLAVINILPLPALDGGRVLFLIIEKIRRKPVDRRIEGIVHQIGFAMLLLLALLVTIQDVRRFGGQIIDGLMR
ncbi:RIP metalloprotease RseP [Patescibacteria group bacterium]|nr:MAG: RIP metalloprotease RseP [Patescibacteria group bacterium]